jgi:hypothetical protein
LYFVFSTFTFSHGQQLELKLPDNIWCMVYKLLSALLDSLLSKL